MFTPVILQCCVFSGNNCKPLAANVVLLTPILTSGLSTTKNLLAGSWHQSIDVMSQCVGEVHKKNENIVSAELVEAKEIGLDLFSCCAHKPWFRVWVILESGGLVLLSSEEDRGMFSLDRVSHRRQFSSSGMCLQKAGPDCRAEWSLGFSICKPPEQTRG